MKIEMISTGEEVLSGQIVDTNAAWFANVLMDNGLELQRRTTVGDRMEDLIDIFQERSKQADVILINGGLGPTTDDLSAEAAAAAMGVNLVEHTGWLEHLESWFANRGRTMPESNYKQCLLPDSAILVDNPVGSAPGFRLKLNNAWLFFTPGVPYEFKRMVEEQFLAFVQETFGVTDPTRLAKLVTIGHGESTLADQLTALPVPPGITLGYRPSPPIVEIKVFARGSAAIKAMDDYVFQVKEALGTAIVTDRFSSIAEEVHTLLVEQQQTLAIAESCTGGMLTSQLVDFAGSSDYLLGGLVTYANAAKKSILGVATDTLAARGAVSLETAAEMAIGARRQLGSHYALATTGIAGPDGGTDDKPVGLVVIALCDGEQCWVQAVRLVNRTRTLVRIMTCAVAHDMLRRRLLGENPIVDYPFIERRDMHVLTIS
jgi:nicotinamide-nucleotide amidase